MPKLAEVAVWAASAKVAPKLRQIAPIKLLIDSNIHSYAVTHEEAWIDTGTKLWGGVHPMPTGYVARIPVHSAQNTSSAYRDICRLTVITSLARKGLFELYTSAELMAERDRHPQARFRSTGYSTLSLIDRLEMQSLDGWNVDAFTRGGATSADLQDRQTKRIKAYQDPLHAAILATFGSEKHSQDSWHLRTAQAHGMYAFLTMDYSLIRMVAAQRDRLARVGFFTQVLTPTQLGEELGFGEVPPHFFSFTDASFPVRADLCMPDEKRRPAGKRKP